MAKRYFPTNEPLTTANATGSDPRNLLIINDYFARILTHDCYYGSASDLIAAGIVRPEQLPGAEGLPRTGVTFYGGQLVPRYQRCKHDEKHMNIIRYGNGFRVFVGVNAQVQAARKANYERWKEICSNQREVQEAEERAAAVVARKIHINAMRAEYALDVIPKSSGDYQSRLIDNWHRHARHMRSSMTSRPAAHRNGHCEIDSLGCGFSLDESDLIEFDALVDEMTALLTNATVRFNAQEQRQVISNCRTAIAKGDNKFQRLLSRLI